MTTKKIVLICNICGTEYTQSQLDEECEYNEDEITMCLATDTCPYCMEEY